MREFLMSALGAFGGTVGFSIMINAPRRTILPASLTALLGYALYELLGEMGQSDIFCYFLSTVVITVLCEIEARAMRMPATIFLLSALVPLVPGYQFYCAMLALVENSGGEAARAMLVAVQGVAAIAVGAAVASCVFRALSSRKRRAAR